jgi:hypothetical protein|tara:strand:- start:9190 stop:9378 length:189 start_codon:yes stop_codon:yes gene_type:complete
MNDLHEEIVNDAVQDELAEKVFSILDDLIDDQLSFMSYEFNISTQNMKKLYEAYIIQKEKEL